MSRAGKRHELDVRRKVTIGDLVRIAAGMMPTSEIQDDAVIYWENGMVDLIARAAGVPDERDYLVSDAIAWANS